MRRRQTLIAEARMLVNRFSAKPMTRSIIIAALITLALLCGSSNASYQPLANAGARGLNVRYIDHVLQLDPAEVDLAKGALIVSEEWSRLVDSRRYLDELDGMALEFRDRMRKKNIPMNYRAISELNKYLFREHKFRAVSKATDPNDLFLHKVLERKRGYCLSLSVLYLAMGERLGLPLYGVVVPGHFFVRYDDGSVRFNIETTNGGGTAKDEHYIENYSVPPAIDGIYMLNLNKLQTLGCFFNNLGNVYSDMHDTESALMAFARAVEVAPTLAEARTNLGNVYLKLGKLDDAVSEYRAALKINPNDAKTRNNLGNAYTDLGKLSMAVDEYTLAQEIEPDYIDAYRNLALAYTKFQRYAQAVNQLRIALSLSDEDGPIYSQLGDVYSRTGNFEQAINYFKEALERAPRQADAHFGMAVCYNRLGKTDQEIQAYKKALALKPKMVPAIVNLGNAHLARKEYVRAIQLYKEATVLTPGDASIFQNLGAAYLHNSSFGEAVKAYSKATDLDPAMGDAHHGLGYGYYRLGDFERALVHLQKARQLGANVPQIEIDAVLHQLRQGQ